MAGRRMKHFSINTYDVVSIVLSCRGHPNVQLAHETTLELAASDTLTVRGDCILCVRAVVSSNMIFPHDIGVEGVDAKLKVTIYLLNPWLDSTRVEFRCKRLCAWKRRDRIVFRKSRVCKDDTVASLCEASAADLPSEVKRYARDPYTMILVIVNGYTLR